MNNTWKITNTSKSKIKVSVALGGANNPGVILEPGEMVLSIAKLTGPLDKQVRSGFIEIDGEFDNSELNLPLGKSMKNIDEAVKNVEDYFGK